MDKLLNWRRWSWDEIYTSLTREGLSGEAFEVERELVEDPIRCGADRALGERGWDYRFEIPEGPNLYVRDLGDRYSAFLDEDGPKLAGGWADEQSLAMLPAPEATIVAAWAGFMVFLGSLLVVLETTWSRVS